MDGQVVAHAKSTEQMCQHEGCARRLASRLGGTLDEAARLPGEHHSSLQLRFQASIVARTLRSWCLLVLDENVDRDGLGMAFHRAWP
jgi:hypothetical protein